VCVFLSVCLSVFLFWAMFRDLNKMKMNDKLITNAMDITVCKCKKMLFTV